MAQFNLQGHIEGLIRGVHTYLVIGGHTVSIPKRTNAMIGRGLGGGRRGGGVTNGKDYNNDKATYQMR